MRLWGGGLVDLDMQVTFRWQIIVKEEPTKNVIRHGALPPGCIDAHLANCCDETSQCLWRCQSPIFLEEESHCSRYFGTTVDSDARFCISHQDGCFQLFIFLRPFLSNSYSSHGLIKVDIGLSL